jgi:phage baseplate assembly protein W
MPLERITKEFKDISMTLQVNPLNNDLIAIKNETAIARSIRNLIYTNPGERFFNPDIGSDIRKSLFEPLDDITASVIKTQIENVINNYEPRVNLISVNVIPIYDDYEFSVTINYNIIGIDALPQQLSFALQSVR